ncbi:hypothetical protein EMIT0158MI4_270003 [Burkholderia ambifaria]
MSREIHRRDFGIRRLAPQGAGDEVTQRTVRKVRAIPGVMTFSARERAQGRAFWS